MKTIERDVPFTLYLHVGLAPLSQRRNDIIAYRVQFTNFNQEIILLGQHVNENYITPDLLILIRVIMLVLMLSDDYEFIAISLHFLNI